MQFSILGLTLLGLAAASPLNYNTTLARRELGWNITIANTAIPLTRRHLENTTVASTALTNTTLTPRHLGWNVTVANTTITIPRRRRGSHTTLASNAITNTTLTPRHAGWNITVANTTITIPRRQLSSLCGSGLGVPQCCDFSLTGRANANCDPRKCQFSPLLALLHGCTARLTWT